MHIHGNGINGKKMKDEAEGEEQEQDGIEDENIHLTGLRRAFEELCACFVSLCCVVLCHYCYRSAYRLLGVFHCSHFISHSDCPHQMLPHHVHTTTCSQCVHVRKCTAALSRVHIFTTLHWSVNGVCHLCVCLSLWKCVCVYCSSLKCICGTLFSFYFYTQELKTRPYSPLHTCPLCRPTPSPLPSLCHLTLLSETFFPVMLLLKFSLLYATAVYRKRTGCEQRQMHQKQRFRKNKLGVFHIVRIFGHGIWTLNMNHNAWSWKLHFKPLQSQRIEAQLC